MIDVFYCIEKELEEEDACQFFGFIFNWRETITRRAAPFFCIRISHRRNDKQETHQNARKGAGIY
jgi:hypothetical protein